MAHFQKPLMGLCPIGKFVFSNEDAIRQKEKLQQLLVDWDVPYIDLEGIIEDGLVKGQEQVDAVVDYLKSKEVQCLFIPHCNFGTEGAAGVIAHKLGLPTLLWGPRDAAPEQDGTRLRDTLCGLFATSKVLHKMGVQYSYIENCHPSDPALKEGIDTFLRAVNIAGVFRQGVRIAHIGQRIDFFWTTICNESELLERYNIEIIPVDMVEFLRAVKIRAEGNRSVYLPEVESIRDSCIVEALEDQQLINILAVRDEMLHTAQTLNVDGLAVQDFMSIVDETGAYCFFSDSMVAEKYGLGFESDIHGAISDIVLRRASFDSQPAFLSDLTVRHPENDNAILLWHAGAPVSMKHPDAHVRLGKHWILPSPLSGMPHFRLKEGPITVLRFDGDRGEYELAYGEGHSVDGPETLNNYTWMEVSDWPQWERTLIEGPFIHHAAMAYGHYAKAIAEAAKYMPGITMRPLDGV